MAKNIENTYILFLRDIGFRQFLLEKKDDQKSEKKTFNGRASNNTWSDRHRLRFGK